MNRHIMFLYSHVIALAMVVAAYWLTVGTSHHVTQRHFRRSSTKLGTASSRALAGRNVISQTIRTIARPTGTTTHPGICSGASNSARLESTFRHSTESAQIDARHQSTP